MKDMSELAVPLDRLTQLLREAKPILGYCSSETEYKAAMYQWETDILTLGRLLRIHNKNFEEFAFFKSCTD